MRRTSIHILKTTTEAGGKDVTTSRKEKLRGKRSNPQGAWTTEEEGVVERSGGTTRT